MSLEICTLFKQKLYHILIPPSNIMEGNLIQAVHNDTLYAILNNDIAVLQKYIPDAVIVDYPTIVFGSEIMCQINFHYLFVLNFI